MQTRSCSSSNTTSTNSIGRAVGGRLHNLLSPKSKSLPTVTISKPIKLQRKRASREMTPDENLDNARDAAAVRPRLTSESTESVDTVRDFAREEGKKKTLTRTRKSSMSAGSPPLVNVAPKSVQGRGATRNTTATKVANGMGSENPPRRRSKRLARTKSFHDLSDISDSDDCEFSFAEPSVSVVEAGGDSDDEGEQRSPNLDPFLDPDAENATLVTSLAKGLGVHEAASLFEEEPPSTKSAWNIFTDDWDKVNLEVPTSSLPNTLRETAVSTRQDNYGSMRARLRRYDVTIAPKCKHIEMWDISLDLTYAWPGMIVIQDAQPCGPRTIPRMPVKDVEIDWRTVEGRYTLALEDADAPPEYACRTEGAALPEKEVVSAMDPTQGICTEPGWSYVGPNFLGAGVGGAWVMKFWVPVPMSLFEGRECWQFQVRAKVWFGNLERMEWVGHSGPVNVMVEHLRREREMGKRPASRK